MIGVTIILAALIIGWFALSAGILWLGVAERDAVACVFGGVALVFGIGVCALLYESTHDPSPSITLQSKNWECTASRTILVPMLVGKITVLRPQERCTQWSEK